MYEIETSNCSECNAADDAFDEIAEICGCRVWEYPGQVVRDVLELKKRLDFTEEWYAIRLERLCEFAKSLPEDKKTEFFNILANGDIGKNIG